MNRFPFLTFLKLQSAPRKARVFSGMAVGGFCDHQGTFSRMLPSTQLLHGAGVSTAVRRWGEVAGLHTVGMRFPKRFQETVFLQDAARGRGKEWILWLTTKSGKFQLTAVQCGSKDQPSRSTATGGRECQGPGVRVAFFIKQHENPWC